MSSKLYRLLWENFWHEIPHYGRRANQLVDLLGYFSTGLVSGDGRSDSTMVCCWFSIKSAFVFKKNFEFRFHNWFNKFSQCFLSKLKVWNNIQMLDYTSTLFLFCIKRFLRKNKIAFVFQYVIWGAGHWWILFGAESLLGLQQSGCAIYCKLITCFSVWFRTFLCGLDQLWNGSGIIMKKFVFWKFSI